VALNPLNTLTPSFTPTTPGVYLFALKVSDGVADSLTDFVQITVRPRPGEETLGERRRGRLRLGGRRCADPGGTGGGGLLAPAAALSQAHKSIPALGLS
jgi:hypothetical protein